MYRARVFHAAYSDDGGSTAGMQLLTSPEPPTAVMTGADVAALGVHRAAHELGLTVPDDLSLAGYNNTAVAAALTSVQLTSVDQAGHTMGAAAAKMLIERVEGHRDGAMQTTMTPRLVVRSSTSAPPQRHGRAGIKDVAREVGVSLGRSLSLVSLRPVASFRVG